MNTQGHRFKTIEVSDDFPMQPQPGYVGAFTRATAPGAIPSGSRVRKANSEEEDANPDGTLGTVLGSISHPKVYDGKPLYFVEWDTRPRLAVSVMAYKVEAA